MTNLCLWRCSFIWLDELVAFNDGTSDKRPYEDIHPSEHDEE